MPRLTLTWCHIKDSEIYVAGDSLIYGTKVSQIIY